MQNKNATFGWRFVFATRIDAVDEPGHTRGFSIAELQAGTVPTRNLESACRLPP